MKTKTLIFSAVAVGAIVLTGLYGLSAVSVGAQGVISNPITQRLAERFNLNSDEVQEVFQEMRQEKREMFQIHFGEKLDEAVSEGVITQEQKEVILSKKIEMQERKEEFRNLSAEERKQAIIELKQEMKDWAEENNIDFQSFKGSFAPKSGGKGFFKGGPCLFDK